MALNHCCLCQHSHIGGRILRSSSYGRHSIGLHPARPGGPYRPSFIVLGRTSLQHRDSEAEHIRWSIYSHESVSLYRLVLRHQAYDCCYHLLELVVRFVYMARSPAKVPSSSTAVSMAPQWADQPYSLISTDPFPREVCFWRIIGLPDLLTTTVQTSHEAYYVAVEMAYAHNGVIRGLNAIYLQAPHVPRNESTTVRDFLIYCQCWCESMHHHHDVEEETFFPAVERVAKSPGLMEHNVEQHRAFTPGFEAFYEYVRVCKTGDYEGQKIKDLIEAFAQPLMQHLYDEIDTLRALDKYDGKQVRQAYDKMDQLMRATDNVRRSFLDTYVDVCANLLTVSDRSTCVRDCG